ncbi:MAG: type II CAAX endopeptidase family protein [Candidatus ainarchaeum sp.]|nr:type II CAAX endopeptidase family protein [Candidatus ainarchaeum sp.]
MIEFGIDLLLFLIPIYFLILLNPKENIKNIFLSLGFKKISFKDIFKHTIILFFLLFLLSYTLSFISVFFKISDLNLVGQEILKLPISVLIYMFVIRVFLEEWFFRSFLVPKIGAIFSSIIFAIAHIGYGSIIQVLGAFFLGVLLSVYYKKTGSIIPNYFAHFLYNLSIYLILVVFI